MLILDISLRSDGQHCCRNGPNDYTLLAPHPFQRELRRRPQIPAAAAKQSNGALLLLARRRPGGSLPFGPLLRHPPPAPPLPASSCGGPTSARPAVAPWSPLVLRLDLFFVASAATRAAGRAWRLRGTGTLFSSLVWVSSSF